MTQKYLRIGYYRKIQTDALVENRYCRIVAKLRDFIISTSLDEFLRRYYRFSEISERIPKIAKYYRNYLLFFCKPIFTNLFINKLIHVYGELKGELYYNANYGSKNNNKDHEKDKNNNNNNKDKDKENNKDKQDKNKALRQIDLLFSHSIKNDIDKNSMTISTIVKDISYLNMNPLNWDFLNAHNALNEVTGNNRLTSNLSKNKKSGKSPENFLNKYETFNNRVNSSNAINPNNMNKPRALYSNKKKVDNFNAAITEKFSMNSNLKESGN